MRMVPAMIRLRSRRPGNSQGFTLIELLVVVMIGGLLAAIALPSFLNQSNKAKQVEAKLYLGSLNRAQQAYMLEHLHFTSNPDKLSVVLTPSTNYQFSIVVSSPDRLYAIHHAESLHSTLHSYVGMTAIVQQTSGEAATSSVVCEAKQAGIGKAGDPIHSTSNITCASTTKAVE